MFLRRMSGVALVTSACTLLAVLGAAPGHADGSVPNPAETVTTGLTPTQLATSLVGAGVAVSNVTYTGAPDAIGHFTFTDPTVVGFGQGLVMSSGKASDVVGPNVSDSTSTDWSAVPPYGAGDTDLSALSTFPTYDASVLEFDFTPSANQVVFSYAFSSDEYPEWVHTPYNDVFAFFVNGTNCATVRQVAGDPAAPFVPVAVNNINNSNPVLSPPPAPDRPDLFRANYVNPAGPSALDLEQDGITTVLTCQAPVNPGVTNHMKLAIADSSDPVYDSAVFIQSGSLVSNENPVADLSLTPDTGNAPLQVTAAIEGEDPNGHALTYSLDWGDGSAAATGSLPDLTTLEHHTYTSSGHFTATLTVSNGTLTGTSHEDVEVTAVPAAPVVTTDPTDQSVLDGAAYSFTAAATGVPAPTVQWQVLAPGAATWADVPDATATTYGGTAALAQNGERYRAVFTNSEGSATTAEALLTVTAPDTTPPTLAPSFSATQPFLRGATGIVASANATDASGIASQSCDPVVTGALGAHALTCAATDNAGNTAQVSVDYVVGLGWAAVSPAEGSSFRRTAGIPVSFRLVDAVGPISDSEAATLRSSLTVRFGSLTAVVPTYSKKTHLYSTTLKTAKPAAGSYLITLDLTRSGATLAHRTIGVTIQ